MSFKSSKHFVKDRMNGIRNNLLIIITELNSIFNRLTVLHVEVLKKLSYNDTFNIRCTVSHINMCLALLIRFTLMVMSINVNIVITVMRKKGLEVNGPQRISCLT